MSRRTPTTESATGASRAADGVNRNREYAVLHTGSRWCVIHRRLDDLWRVVAILGTRDEAEEMIEDIYNPGRPARRNSPRRPVPQLAGQLDIYGSEVAGE